MCARGRLHGPMSDVPDVAGTAAGVPDPQNHAIAHVFGTRTEPGNAQPNMRRAWHFTRWSRVRPYSEMRCKRLGCGTPDTLRSRAPAQTQVNRRDSRAEIVDLSDKGSTLHDGIWDAPGIHLDEQPIDEI